MHNTPQKYIKRCRERVFPLLPTLNKTLQIKVWVWSREEQRRLRMAGWKKKKKRGLNIKFGFYHVVLDTCLMCEIWRAFQWLSSVRVNVGGSSGKHCEAVWSQQSAISVTTVRSGGKMVSADLKMMTGWGWVGVLPVWWWMVLRGLNFKCVYVHVQVPIKS